MIEFVKEATRESYGKALCELGKVKEDFIVLDADLSSATKTGSFKKEFPERFYNCGIAEQNMVAIAAGVATTGKRVFASSFAMFTAGRAFEQIRNSIGYPHLNVVIAATHAGITVGEDGASHQCCEDIALMRTIPGMTIISPADPVEAYAAVFAAAECDGPVYLRFGRLAVPVLHDPENFKFEIGKANTLKEGKDVAIIANGVMVNEAMEAAKLLEAEGISAKVINMATIKPLDTAAVLAAAKECGAIVTAEEHTVIGGLGAAVAEYLSENCPTPVVKVGVEDVFGRSGGAAKLMEIYGLKASNIVEKAKKAISMK